MSFLGNLWDKATDIGHKITGIPTEDEKRNMQKQITNQIKAYKEQTELTRNEMNNKRNEEVAVKRQVEEKQIRALRRHYTAAGLLGGQATSQPDMNTKLGG